MSFKALEESVLGNALSAFGESVTYSHAAGGTSTIKAIFDNQFVAVQETATYSPTLKVRLSDLLLQPSKGDSVSISSVNYRVLESRPDGFGGSTLILQKV